MPPRFRPRFELEVPRSFGIDPQATWKSLGPTPSAAQREQRGAARIQHAVACWVRAAAIERFGSVAAYAKHFELDYQREGGLLRGDVVMRLEDVAGARLRLGLPIRIGSQPGEKAGGVALAEPTST
ncbi:hypothetical protein G3T36_18030 [Diaminobutyricibacter tongyongensis]|uniref:Uncharacterized protein n=1 Tax=Leifsonia tongyongensis TaxID=1268043 RepID=A0A6L9Y240_9MICO|nr:hypothetical protein [Diaminobutyricibacter tongyongensis]NEN07759.1 hypothetical protein [Diaminobutyricibacter tongyongensis]